MVSNELTRKGRFDIDICYQYKMLSLFVNFGLERKPLEVHKRLMDWFNVKHSEGTSSPDLVKNLSWDNSPSYKTVQRYLEKTYFWKNFITPILLRGLSIRKKNSNKISVTLIIIYKQQFISNIFETSQVLWKIKQQTSFLLKK